MSPQTEEFGTPTDATQLVSLAGKYLSFFLVDEAYGLEILRVHEIIRVLPITRIPRTQAYVLGVINLRGKVIPVVDLRTRFGMPRATSTEETCIIVVRVHGFVVGLQVDRVSDVFDIAAEEIEPAPNFGQHFDTDYLLAMGNCDGSVKLLIDLDQVVPERAPSEEVQISATREMGS